MKRTCDFLSLNHDGEAVISTIYLSHLLGRRHYDLLRSIDAIQCSPEFRKKNFHTYTYLYHGKKCRMYMITRDGFTFLPIKITPESIKIIEILITEYSQLNLVKMFKFGFQLKADQEGHMPPLIKSQTEPVSKKKTICKNDGHELHDGNASLLD